MRQSRRFFAMAVYVSTLSLGCGYFRAGTWEDDPRNWDRAFNSTKPENVVVVRSRYWRSPHWSYEFQYFFHIRGDAAFSRELFERNALKQVPPTEVAGAIRDPFQKAPLWFCPKQPERYDAWSHRDSRAGHFRVIIDRETGDVFLTDYQV